MNVFRVQKIRSCVQCGDVLSQRCTSCVKHPDRVPRIVEFHDWPTILKVAECGCCVQVACQNPSCDVKVWRTKRFSSTGLSRSATLFCSKRCNVVTQNAARDTRISVPCGWCAKPVRRRSAMLKTFKNVYCRPDHYYLAEAKKRHAAKEAIAFEKSGTDGRALLQCGKCKDVTEHSEVNANNAQCESCSTVRKIAVMV